MTRHDTNHQNLHSPENAEHEIRKAYNCVIETGVTYFWNQKAIPGVHADEVISQYKKAFDCYRNGNRLAAERWARTAKHLARAAWHEAKISYLEPRVADLPFLRGAQEDEYHLHERANTTADLLNSVSDQIPPGLKEMPQEMIRYLNHGKKHLASLENPNYKNELLIAERIKAAHEYGRVLECITLAYEAEAPKKVA